jgi:epoxyqueuosine reductase
MTARLYELSEKVKEQALRLGFNLAGITLPAPPPHWSKFQDWLAGGRNASMTYLADPRRADARLLLPECRSILVLALPYPNPANINPASTRTGQIASYARGIDYHLLTTELLEELAESIQQLAGVSFPYRCCCDSAPLLERDLAQQAGLGWIGKNTCLIHPRQGSAFFLAELLLGIDLKPDSPFTEDRCGTCRRCLDACPTGCILPDRTLEAGRCLSYLTIENKGEIPTDLRPKIGTWLFGCDICQHVCPWNQRPLTACDPRLLPRPGIPPENLLEDLVLDRQAFSQKYKNSPLLRAKWTGYFRNACIVLGNIQDPSAIALLMQLRDIGDPLVKDHAEWALARIQAGQFNTPEIGNN